MSQYLVFVLLAAGCGACFALQASANGKFRLNLGSPLYATFFSICGTFVTAVSAMLVFRPSVPSNENLAVVRVSRRGHETVDGRGRSAVQAVR